MADGFGRFQGASQYYYPQQNQQANHPRHLHRNGSPINNTRGLFQPNADTPSPNRSPGTHSPAHNPYSMYNHNSHQQNQHNLLNGGTHQQYQMRMNLQKQHYPQNHHQNHHLNQQHQEHGGQNHGSNFGNHQHNISSGALSSNTPHFTPAHLQNGTPNNAHGGLNKPPNDHWAEQMKMYNDLRGVDKPHFYARNDALINRQVPSSHGLTARKDEDNRERQRASDDDDQELNSWYAIDFGGSGLKSMAPSVFRYNFLKRIYFNHNRLNYLTPQIGTMRGLTVLDLSMNQLEMLPPEIGMLTNLKKLLLFDNHLVELPYEMGSLYQLEILGVEGNPLRDEFKDIIVEHGTAELIRYLREQAPIPDPPEEDREWHELGDSDSPDHDIFSVLSYNILCERAATQTAYGYTPAAALSWEQRKSTILHELEERNADILCLQEVDSDCYNEFLRPSLALHDYKGVFYQKSRALTMGEKESKLVDGCATFYKSSKYILLDKHLIMLSREAINRPDMKGEHDIYNRVMPRDHIATVVFLENRATGSRLIVVNTHLSWEKWLRDVKVVQVAIMMQEVTKLAEKYAEWPPCKDKEVFRYANMDDDSLDGVEKVSVEPAPSVRYMDGADIPMVIGGDFNSQQDSGVYELLTQGSISNSHADWGDRKYGDFTRNGINHPFSLKSSYAQIGELAFTNYTPDFIDVIDYILYSTNSLSVTRLLGDVEKEYMQRVAGFPNWHFPSDHISLCAWFAVRGRKEKKITEVDFGPQRDRRP